MGAGAGTGQGGAAASASSLVTGIPISSYLAITLSAWSSEIMATAALTLAHHNGRTEGVNTKTKMIKRQMYGRAGFTLLRHRILLS
jgi:transposase